MPDLRMPNTNLVVLSGRLTRDPELKYLASGTPVCKLRIAHSRKYKTKDGEEREDRLFIDADLWGKPAEYVGSNFGKGDPLVVEGRLQMDEWESDGQKRQAIRLNLSRVEALSWPETKREETRHASENSLAF